MRRATAWRARRHSLSGSRGRRTGNAGDPQHAGADRRRATPRRGETADRLPLERCSGRRPGECRLEPRSVAAGRRKAAMPRGGDGPRDGSGAWCGLLVARAGSGGPGGDLRPLMAIQARRITRTIPERWLRLLPLSLFIFVTLGPLLAVLGA